jgi:hypothetical protein
MVIIMDWIKCSERLPDVPDDYLIYTNEKLKYVASWGKIWESKNYFQWVIRCECCNAEDCLLTQDMVTHWMPLPTPPKKEDTQKCTQ